MRISTLNNKVNQNLSYTDFIRNNEGELVHKDPRVLINRPMTNEMLDSYSSKGVR